MKTSFSRLSIVGITFGFSFMLLGLWGGIYAASNPMTLFTVNSTADVTDANPGDGVCETAVGNSICTLRAAVRETNALAGLDEIILPAGIYTLTLVGTGNNAGDLDVQDDLILTGAGADVTIIDANGIDRVMELLPIAGLANLHVEGVTLRGGEAGSNGGGGLTTLAGVITVTNSLITQNNAESGGGIWMQAGWLTLEGSTVSYNDGGALPGGGIYVSGGVLVMTNTAVLSNTTADSGGG